MAIIDSPPGPVASYAYEDIQEGFGYEDYFLCELANDSGTSYLITKEPLYSRSTTIAFYNTSGSDTKTFYSGQYAQPRLIRGNIILNFCSKGEQGAGGQTYSFEIKVYKYNSTGPTSTQIGSTWTSETISLTTPARTRPVTAIIELTDSVSMAIGDQLKVEVKCTYNCVSGGDVEYGIDPQNRDSAVTTYVSLQPSTYSSDFTIFLMKVPYRIEG